MTAPAGADRRIVAIADLVGRSSAEQFQLRYSDEEKPVVWMALAVYSGSRWDVAAGHTPLEAASRLLEQLVDGGTCQRCGRGTAVADDQDDVVEALDAAVCWYVYDPELNTYRRSCEDPDGP